MKEKKNAAMEDRRIFARFPVEFPLRFLNLDTNQEEDSAVTCDISGKGIGFLTTNKDLTNRTPLEIWLQIPDKGEPLYTRGDVVWSKKLKSNKDKYQVGIELKKAELVRFSRILRAP